MDALAQLALEATQYLGTYKAAVEVRQTMSGIKITAADKRFSLQIRERANFTCEKCGAVHARNSRGMQCHHLFTRSIKATRFDPDNGVALCYPCHMRAHQYQEDTRAFFAAKMGQARFDALAARAHGRRDRVK